MYWQWDLRKKKLDEHLDQIKYLSLWADDVEITSKSAADNSEFLIWKTAAQKCLSVIILMCSLSNLNSIKLVAVYCRSFFKSFLHILYDSFVNIRLSITFKLTDNISVMLMILSVMKVLNASSCLMYIWYISDSVMIDADWDKIVIKKVKSCLFLDFFKHTEFKMMSFFSVFIILSFSAFSTSVYCLFHSFCLSFCNLFLIIHHIAQLIHNTLWSFIWFLYQS